MSASAKPMTVDAFLDWEERQPVRYEWDGVQTTAMVGGSRAHSTIKVNLVVELGLRLRDRTSRLFDSDAKLIVDGHVRYPDASISCTPQSDEVYERQGVVEHPVIVFEVLSVGTSTQDRTDKNRGYRATPSIQRYVMLEHDRIAATVFSRSAKVWTGEPLFGPDAALELPEADIAAIPLAGLYRNSGL